MDGSPGNLEIAGVLIMMGGAVAPAVYLFVRKALGRRAFRELESSILLAASFVVASIGLAMIGVARGAPIQLLIPAGAILGVPVFWSMRRSTRKLLDSSEEVRARRARRAPWQALGVMAFLCVVIFGGTAANLIWGEPFLDESMIFMLVLVPAACSGYAAHAVWVRQEEKRRGGALYRILDGFGPFVQPTYIEVRPFEDPVAEEA